MKRYFVGWIFAVAVLGLSGVAQTPNLRLILEGPFVVCENVGADTLTIALPNLQGTHYVPGFTSDLFDLSLGTDKNSGPDGNRYHAVADGMRSTMTISKWTPSRNMKLKPPLSTTPAFYSEKADCSSLNKSLASIVFNVPVPDELLAIHPTSASIYIADHANANSLKGSCQTKMGCKYATRFVLRYDNLDKTSDVEIKTTCKHAKCTDLDDWHPLTTSVASGNEFELELTAEPMPDPNQLGHAKAAFKAASLLSGRYRDLKPGEPGNPHVEDVVFHRVCQIPPVVLCKNYDVSGACPAN
jgi:hypothetical protein